MRTRFLAPVGLFCALAVSAQTYNPKTIRLQGANEMDQPEVMRLIGLKSGAPVTKDQIEAAMQRLADSGLFADLSYAVGPDALVFVLKPVEGAQALPVRYSNFVWWQAAELEPLVEARVPLFHGTLPLTGQLTDQVKAALVALLAEKGITDARVTAMPSVMGTPAMSLTITQPTIMLGEIHISGIAPSASEQMGHVVAGLSSDEFDGDHTADSIRNNTLDTHRNAGFLDATVDPPVFSPPRKVPQGFAVDATATVRPGDRYHITAVSFSGVPPGMEGEVARAAGVNPGDAAGEMNVHIAEGLAARALENHGLLEASAKAEVSKDAAAHTVAYRFAVVPGPVYTFAGVDVSALPPDVQHRFLAAFHAKPGATADISLRTEIFHSLHATGVPATGFAISTKRDRATHSATFVLSQRSAPAVPATAQ